MSTPRAIRTEGQSPPLSLGSFAPFARHAKPIERPPMQTAATPSLPFFAPPVCPWDLMPVPIHLFSNRFKAIQNHRGRQHPRSTVRRVLLFRLSASQTPLHRTLPTLTLSVTYGNLRKVTVTKLNNCHCDNAAFAQRSFALLCTRLHPFAVVCTGLHRFLFPAINLTGRRRT